MFPADMLRSAPSGSRGPRSLRSLGPEEVEELREALRAKEQGDAADRAARGPIDSGKGVRIQGGRVYGAQHAGLHLACHVLRVSRCPSAWLLSALRLWCALVCPFADSKFGVTCHWCRQKTLEDHVTCSNPGCGGGRRIPTSFCKMCLRNRHGEDCDAAYLSGAWHCPCCRGSCGAGCVLCCNCGPCRKKASLEPTGQVLRYAKQQGFDNVHDYLVHLVTKETPAEIAARKSKFAWGAWMHEAAAPAAAAPEAAQQGDDAMAQEEAEEKVEVLEEEVEGEEVAAAAGAPRLEVAPVGKGKAPVKRRAAAVSDDEATESEGAMVDGSSEGHGAAFMPLTPPPPRGAKAAAAAACAKSKDQAGASCSRKARTEARVGLAVP